jgi:putative oxidoreductase
VQCSGMLQRVLRPRAEVVFAALRIVAGTMFALHGAQKLFGVLGGTVPAPGTQLWFGAIIELTAGSAIALGIATPWMAFLASGTMAVAYVQFHWKLDFGAGFFPPVNKGELALIYCLFFLYLACRGPGPASWDGARLARRGTSAKG